MNFVPAHDPVRARARSTAALHSGLLGEPAPRAFEAWSKIDEMPRWLHRALRAAAKAEADALPAAEWLLDNAYRVQRAVILIRKDMPRSFYAQLRQLADGPAKGEPLVLALAHDVLEATHFQMTREGLLGYLEEYQLQIPLSSAELWALPVMLRLACLERLVAGFAAAFAQVPAPFAISACCKEHMSGDPCHCVARAIANLTVISSIAWKDVFDAVSLLERRLREEPAAIYTRMDFDTRDSYCRAVERLARRAGWDELAVVDAALTLAAAQPDLPGRHVGYWLIGPGLPALEFAVSAPVSPARWFMRFLGRHPGMTYSTALLILGLIGLLLPAGYLAWVGADPPQWAIGLALSILPATVVSVTAVNWLVTHLVKPSTLPKLDFADGIADEWPTLVVVPAIVGSPEEVAELAGRLESHFLANPSAAAYVLLSDPADAQAESPVTDQPLEARLRAAICGLNRRYANPEGNGPFCLLHRARKFNQAQNLWMAWERKRGKLEELNAAVLSGDLSAFPVREGALARIAGARLIVTADADTQLPPGTVARMAGTLAHPLNRPVFNAKGRVSAGYTILQPRVEIAPSSDESPFARLFGGDTAIDIYSRAVSDVYQDLTGSGNFVGKGIYDVVAFSRSLEGRVPENSLLSHDLWEGLHGRAGLLSDVIIYETFPSSYAEYARRWHRWVRGDWQLLPWLLPHVPGAGGTRLPNRLSLFDRLRIWDNMRRSIVSASVLLLLLAGWFILPGAPLIWTILALCAPGAHLFTDLVTGLARGRRRGVQRGALRQQAEQVGRWAFSVAFLVSDSIIALHAIVITMLRLGRHRNLLEWTSAAAVNRQVGTGHPRLGQWQAMWPSPAFVVLLMPAFVLRPAALPVAAPLLVIWLLAPELAYWSGRAMAESPKPLSSDDRSFLRLVARRSWHFFETFVTPQDNWLPPDNHQEEPLPATARRTSPTNIGMMVVAAVAAWRLGYIGSGELTVRMRAMLDSLDRVERWHGHVLNWYDTATLDPLEPRYVSTVDSGNLAVSLIALGNACNEIVAAPVLSKTRWEGLDDCIALIEETMPGAGFEQDASLARTMAELRSTIARSAPDPNLWAALLARCEGAFADIRRAIHDRLASTSPPPLAHLRELSAWIERADHHLATMRQELDLAMPWLAQWNASPEEFHELIANLSRLLAPERRWASIRALRQEITAQFARARGRSESEASRQWLTGLKHKIRRGLAFRALLARRLTEVSNRAHALADAMDFKPLYDKEQRLFYIGYDLGADRLDTHHYDLLASEARLASFFAIAKNDVPAGHWFQLGRPIVKRRHKLALVSWNGSMFEYLMPTIFLRSDPSTLLGRSDRSAIALQRIHGDRHGIPWGISESCFASLGADGSWRYRAFGVPELGLRRGLSEDLVIAPYATALALGVEPLAAVQNLRRLDQIGALTRYGFVEALDFTAGRRRAGGVHAPIRAFMAHHQGMSIGAMANALFDDYFVGLFHADPRIRTVDLLLNERVPWELPQELERVEPEAMVQPASGAAPHPQPWEPASQDESRAVLAIGNGRLETRIAADGSGETEWRGIAVSRPETGATRFGHFLYLREQGSDRAWSPTLAPFRNGSDARCLFHGHKAEFHAQANAITSTLEVFVAPNEDVEIRRIRLVNGQSRERIIELASHVEIALCGRAEWQRHPAFARLFVAANPIAEIRGLELRRRPRDHAEPTPVLVQRLVVPDDGTVHLAGWQTSRELTLGRHGRLDRFPAIDDCDAALAEYPLDPVAALRAQIRLAAHGTAELAIISAFASSSEDAIDLARRYGSLGSLEWAEQDSLDQAARTIQTHGIAPDMLSEVHRLNTVLSRCSGPQPGTTDHPARDDLWAMGISGDYPIVVLELGEDHDNQQVRFILAAHDHLRWLARPFDLVVIHSAAPGYFEPAREHLIDMLRDTGNLHFLSERGGIHILGRERLDHRHLAALAQASAIALQGDDGAIGAQLDRMMLVNPARPPFVPVSLARSEPQAKPLPPPNKPVKFDNGWGGFGDEGEYRMAVSRDRPTPAPWVNILANPLLGTMVSEAGLGFTFAGNSGENRLTPWYNDPLCDPQGEALYLRDEENGAIWTVTPLPAGPAGPCRVVHACGASEWTRRDGDLTQTMTCCVDGSDPVKLVRLALKDESNRHRRITVTYAVDWLLGAVAGEPGHFRHCWYRPDLGAVLATNHWNQDFAGRIAFLAADRPIHSLTTSRKDFAGPIGDWRRPPGLIAWDLGNRTSNRGGDAAGVLQLHLELAPNASQDCEFIIGQVDNEEEAAALIRRWQARRNPGGIPAARRADWNHWLGAVQVETPDPAFDLMINRWLPYQLASSRLHARGGYYQANGAFGFRDQLQDVEALVFSDPELSRRQILRAAAHQFEEGDVLHWWHPPAGRGVRTRYSDDLLWLPHAVARHLAATGEEDLLEARVSFLHAPELTAEEHDRYSSFPIGFEATIHDHCQRAFERAWRLGSHGLPLIGGGDWNDGMNRIGADGRGESVWLGWFMASLIVDFAATCRAAGRPEFGKKWLDRADQLVAAIERHAWDGEWYVRAFDDQGRPWGSHENVDCQIDSLTQSWAAIAGTGDPERTRRALDAAFAALVRPDDRIVRLLDPPFNHTPRDPGYIKAYPPGIRENGGQYSHAAAWLGIGCARVGDGDRAKEVFDRLNPILHARDAVHAGLYRTEPYALAADIGGEFPHLGRGGWTWYSGGAGWTWRLGVEHILGIGFDRGRLVLAPCLPDAWPGFRARLRGKGTIELTVTRGQAAMLTIDGRRAKAGPIEFPGPGKAREVRLVVSTKSRPDLRAVKSGKIES